MRAHTLVTCLLLASGFALLNARLADPVTDPVQHPCPAFCVCRFATRLTAISCQWRPWWTAIWRDVSRFLIENPYPDEISIHGGLTEVPHFEENVYTVRLLKLVNNNLTRLHWSSFLALPYLVHLDLSYSNVDHVDLEVFPRLQQLQYLNLSHNILSAAHVLAFDGLKHLVDLDISYNNISNVYEGTFNGLHQLQYLNLSHNNVQTIPNRVFHDVTLLKVLNLGSNKIETIPQDVFHVLRNIEDIDLSSNRLSYLTSVHFLHLPFLKRLNLAGNEFRMFHYDLMPVFHSIPHVDLSNNPFDCSCAVEALRNSIDELALSSDHSTVFNKTRGPRYKYSSIPFDHLDSLRCQTPLTLAGIVLTALDTTRLSCAAPTITAISERQQVTVQGDVYLNCQAFGYPSPAIVWFTPWGEVYAHRKFHPLLGDAGTVMSTSRSIETINVGKTVVTALENGTLHISRFRGIFAGNFSCLAMGPSGNSTSSAIVSITTFFRKDYMQSLLIGLHCAAATLVVGVIIGFLRVLVCNIRQKLMKKDKEYVEDIEETKSMTKYSESTHCNSNNSYDEDDDDDDDSMSGQSLASPISLTPEPTKKFPTPEDTSPTGWTTGNIIETLDEVRSRLSLGVGRKMEKMRCQVQSFKESGTVYVHNIRTSSSVAANRVRAGVVLGVETIKYSAQSIREFCWNGDMSGQTISMVSVSTNVDTEKQTEVVHTVTFV